MIDYELAKKLKEAGWKGNIGLFSKDIELPTLSELIEACMDFYFPCHFNMGGMNTWWAVMRNETNNKAIVPVQTGSTPEEAVANLWLELKKK